VERRAFWSPFYQGGRRKASWANRSPSIAKRCRAAQYFATAQVRRPVIRRAFSRGVLPTTEPLTRHIPASQQLAAEAVRAARITFGNTTGASNASVQYVDRHGVGTHSRGLGRNTARTTSATSSTVGNVAYTNLPYITDAGAQLRGQLQRPGRGCRHYHRRRSRDGRDDDRPVPKRSWLDSSGAENGDKCAWILLGAGGAAADITLSTGKFPVQSLWSNAFSSGSAAACSRILDEMTRCSPCRRCTGISGIFVFWATDSEHGTEEVPFDDERTTCERFMTARLPRSIW